MPHMLRLVAPGSLVHIMARGIDGRTVFLDDEDHEEFLGRLARHREETGYKCLAWCLMPNHYHLFLRMTEVPPSRLMRPLNAWYARRYNRKYQRVGYVFQDRFKSVLCQDLDYAALLIRYIHLNPIRAGLVSTFENLAAWRWCGHAFLLGDRGAYGSRFQDRNEALRRFGEVPAAAVRGYMRFLRDGLDLGAPERAGELKVTEAFEIKGAAKGWPAVIGDAEFARSAMQRHEVAGRRKHRQADYRAVMHRLARKVCAENNVEPGDLFRKGRSDVRSTARAVFCRRAHFDHLLPYGAIARFLGTTIPPIMMLARRKEGQEAKSNSLTS
jgi:putative transposase